jgi:hypothetical protein
MEKVLPTKHLSARVPWHDNRWNGRTCCNVLDNSFCRILPLIDQRKRPDEEPNDQPIGEDNMPPCVSEKGLFMSSADFTRPLRHAWTDLDTGRIFYWEHLGMMSRQDYREKWIKKLEGYRKDGFVLHTEAEPTDDKVLIITEDNPGGGIDSKHIDELIRDVILI